MKRKVKFLIILMIISALVLVAAWEVPGFSDFYIKYIFPVWDNTYSRLTGLFPFSVGEIMLYAGALYVAITVITTVIRFFFMLFRKKTLRCFVRKNLFVFLSLVVIVVFLQVNNCFVLYHSSRLFENTAAEDYKPSREDLIDLREKLAKRANELCGTFERDEKGYIIYSGDLKSNAVITMQALGEAAKNRAENDDKQILDDKLKLLSGYFPAPKPLKTSGFFSQQYILGYFFPFSMEANYNDMAYVVNLPSTMCHELSHLKGFILEDEANFLSYLGCMNSKDSFFEYSGVVDALAYVELETRRELAIEPDLRESLTPIDKRVGLDSMFLTPENWEIVEERKIFDTEKVKKVSNDFIDKNLTMNGVESGIDSYSEMVQLLLKYYYGGEN